MRDDSQIVFPLVNDATANIPAHMTTVHRESLSPQIHKAGSSFEEIEHNKRMTDNSHWTQHPDKLLSLISAPGLGIISDFDGTLSPFVAQPQDAAITPANAHLLDTLAETGALIALVSGRSAQDLQQRFPRPWAVYYGNHGMELWHDGTVQVAPQVQPWIEPLQALIAAFGSIAIPGVFVENKGATASVHYRMAQDIDAARQRIYERLLPLCERYGFQLSEGQMIWEIKPPVELTKGTAAEAIVTDFHLDNVLFLGDDWTDVSAMQRLRDLADASLADASRGRLRALSIGVVHPTSPPAIYEHCDLTANGVGDVENLLAWISQNRAHLSRRSDK